jgi:hypothetical protein
VFAPGVGTGDARDFLTVHLGRSIDDVELVARARGRVASRSTTAVTRA